MQLSLLDNIFDLGIEGEKIMIGLSGGINSMAVLCYLHKFIDERPKELHLFYAHFDEHSPDTLLFVLKGFEYARKHFKNVFTTITFNSVLDYFEKNKTIHHPIQSGCTRVLKIMPMAEYMARNDIKVDLVGYVRNEKNRMERQQERLKKTGKQKTKMYPIADYSDNDCFSLVEKEIGWYPDIYKIKWTDPKLLPFIEEHEYLFPKDQYKTIHKYATRGYNSVKSTRVFHHNNCLPCKNMQGWEMVLVRFYFPHYYYNATYTSTKIGTYWGREQDQAGYDPKQDKKDDSQSCDLVNATCTFCGFD